MRPLEALIAVLAALPALSVSALDSCPERCRCENGFADFYTSEEVANLYCGRLPDGIDPLVSLTYKLFGSFSRSLTIKCLKKTEDYTCDDIPEFDFGHNDMIGELSFNNCPITLISITCVERRLGVTGAFRLIVHGFQGLREYWEGLQGWRQIELRGKGNEVNITSEALAPLSALEVLKLFHMRLRLAPKAFAGLRALTYLDLTHTDLPPGALANLPALTHLRLDRNNIKNITYDTFQNLTSLKSLVNYKNELSSLDGAVLAAGCPHLRDLDMKQNPLVELRPLGPLQHLERLDIDDCLGRTLEVSPRALAALPQLKSVWIMGCGVRTLPADLFAGSKSLLLLNLGYNQLETLPQELFSGLLGLKYLDLPGNLLKELPDRLLESLPPLPWIYIWNNPLRCDCHLYQQALRQREYAGNDTLPRSNLWDAVCGDPPSLRYRRLADVGLHELGCETPAQLD